MSTFMASTLFTVSKGFPFFTLLLEAVKLMVFADNLFGQPKERRACRWSFQKILAMVTSSARVTFLMVPVDDFHEIGGRLTK